MSKSNNFQKFIGKEEKGAKLKERIRQEKKKVRQETKAYFDQQKQKAKAARGGYSTSTDSKKTIAQSSAKTSDKQVLPPKATQTNRDRKKIEKISIQSSKDSAGKEKNTERTAPTAKSSMPLNKFIAHAGICSRREAADIVKSGKISVNGTAVTEPGFKVSSTDEIKMQGKKIIANRNFVYILLNKPKDHITTTNDPEGRRTVMDIVKNATAERVFPIGRLDRNTTGVLLLTNDGELTQKLSHPSYQVKKIYEVTLDRPFAKKDFDILLNGVTLEDGFISPDTLAYADLRNKAVIGIEIHSGKNRIVRRIFEKLGYDVRNLDRVMYANLTKKNVERGKWRFLAEKEVRLLKFMNTSYGKKK